VLQLLHLQQLVLEFFGQMNLASGLQQVTVQILYLRALMELTGLLEPQLVLIRRGEAWLGVLTKINM
jgi:hypothetical protein